MTLTFNEIVGKAGNESDIGEPHLRLYADIFRQALGVTSGPILEVGTRRGGSAMLWLELMRFYGSHRFLVTVDPYGLKPYSRGSIDTIDYKYGDPEYLASKTHLSVYPNHTHFRLTSEEFLNRLHGSHLWTGGVRWEMGGFGFVFLDGDHDPKGVVADVLNLRRWLEPTGVVLCDNVDWMGTDTLRGVLGHLGPTFAMGGRYIAIQPNG